MSVLTIACPDLRSGPYSVIPAKAEPALDSIRGIHIYGNETAEEFPVFRNDAGKAIDRRAPVRIRKSGSSTTCAAISVARQSGINRQKEE
jgi:hypothetical protein